jgi:hypothetical protein
MANRAGRNFRWRNGLISLANFFSMFDMQFQRIRSCRHCYLLVFENIATFSAADDIVHFKFWKESNDFSQYLAPPHTSPENLARFATSFHVINTHQMDSIAWVYQRICVSYIVAAIVSKSMTLYIDIHWLCWLVVRYLYVHEQNFLRCGNSLAIQYGSLPYLLTLLMPTFTTNLPRTNLTVAS